MSAKTKPTRQQILEAVADLYRIPVKKIIGRQAFKELSPPRRMACVAMKSYGYSLSDIGRTMHRDHTTVRYHLEQARKANQ